MKWNDNFIIFKTFPLTAYKKYPSPLTLSNYKGYILCQCESCKSSVLLSEN